MAIMLTEDQNFVDIALTPKEGEVPPAGEEYITRIPYSVELITGRPFSWRTLWENRKQVKFPSYPLNEILTYTLYAYYYSEISHRKYEIIGTRPNGTTFRRQDGGWLLQGPIWSGWPKSFSVTQRGIYTANIRLLGDPIWDNDRIIGYETLDEFDFFLLEVT